MNSHNGRGAASRPPFHSMFSDVFPAQHFIANRWVAPQAGATLPMIDPSDGLPFAAIAAGTATDIDRAVGAAQRARDGAWGGLAPAEKGRALAKIGQAILDHADELALIEARDCGKPMKQARADVIFANHTDWDRSKINLPALANRATGSPNPYVVGNAKALNFLQVAIQCASARVMAVN